MWWFAWPNAVDQPLGFEVPDHAEACSIDVPMKITHKVLRQLGVGIIEGAHTTALATTSRGLQGPNAVPPQLMQ
eukprot:2471606-Karenia_brevis.AAC.1